MPSIANRESQEMVKIEVYAKVDKGLSIAKSIQNIVPSTLALGHSKTNTKKEWHYRVVVVVVVCCLPSCVSIFMSAIA